jgi:hypothetical protein
VELEKKELPYYPRPRTLYEGHTAETWYQLLLDRPLDAVFFSQTATALQALKQEGMPFLLDYLNRQTTSKGRDTVLRSIQPEHIHPNDLHKLLLRLDQHKNYPATRLLALGYLEKRAKDLPKKLVPEIERLVEDMLTNSKFKEETKEDIRSKLNTIRRESK